MRSKLVFLLTFCIVINALDYQERGIYYSEQDNVCRQPRLGDLITLKINIDGLKTETLESWGGTSCDERARNFLGAISPGSHWVAGNFEQTYLISFHEETRRVYVRGHVELIIQKTTIENPSLFDSKPYNCQIIGDGTVKHFGIKIPNKEPCVYYVKCDQIVSEK